MHCSVSSSNLEEVAALYLLDKGWAILFRNAWIISEQGQKILFKVAGQPSYQVHTLISMELIPPKKYYELRRKCYSIG